MKRAPVVHPRFFGVLLIFFVMCFVCPITGPCHYPRKYTINTCCRSLNISSVNNGKIPTIGNNTGIKIRILKKKTRSGKNKISNTTSASTICMIPSASERIIIFTQIRTLVVYNDAMRITLHGNQGGYHET